MPDKLTKKETGSAKHVLPLACLEPKSVRTESLAPLFCDFARRLGDIINDHLEGVLELEVVRSEMLDLASIQASRPREGSKSKEGIIDSLVSIFSESSLNLKIVEEQDDLSNFLCQDQDDLSNFLYQSQQRPQIISQSFFIGFKVANPNEFEEIQAHGFKCGPGFHLCRTIENAVSFCQFRNQSLSNAEHLWIVLGVEAPPSELRAIDPGKHIWPLACINVSDIGGDQEGMDKLMSDLRRWTQSCATRHHG